MARAFFCAGVLLMSLRGTIRTMPGASSELRAAFERCAPGRAADQPIHVLLLDGAVGMELERGGIACAPPLWSAGALLTEPTAVERLHSEYVCAGADILVANTFRTNPRTLDRAGLIDHGAELNRLAVALARKAVRGGAPLRGGGPSKAATGRRIWVAASVGPVEDCYLPQDAPGDAALHDEHGRMMEWLADAEPDFVWIETIGTVREARAAAQAAAKAGLAFAISFVTQEDGALLGGEPLETAVAAVAPRAPLALGLNCIPPRGLTANLSRLRAAMNSCSIAHLPLAAYAHIGNVRPLPGWTYSQPAVNPAEYTAYARQWMNLGVGIVGGCCGTTPAHIAALRSVIP